MQMLPAEQQDAIKQALAIAIVRQKRKYSTEAAEWKAKAQKLQEELQQQQSSSLELKQWARSILQANAAAGVHPSGPAVALQERCLALPPLEVQQHTGCSASDMHSIYLQSSQVEPQLRACYQQLQQQLLTAAEAGQDNEAVLEVMNGKAAALSSMLLINMRMLIKLQQLGMPQPDQCDAAASNSQSAVHEFDKLAGMASPTATVSLLSCFIKQTLQKVPSSSLRTAYMRQCAAMLAALLTSTAPQQQQQPVDHAAVVAVNPAVTHQHTGQLLQCLASKQQLQQDNAACQVVDLIQHLLADSVAAKAPAGSSEVLQQHPTALANAIAASGSPSLTVSAATAMLQQLAAFPSTALLMALAVAQQLQHHVQQLHDGNTATASVQLTSFSKVMQTIGSVFATAAHVFEASCQLVEELEEAVAQIPTWTVALAQCSWTPKALEDLVYMAAAMYTACQQGLQQHQPLLATAVCEVCASLATALQHVATNTTAPGMRSGSGAALRSTCGGMCMKLRDLFMPAGC